LEIALTTKIQVEHLENLENENYVDLPPEVYIRGFILSYAKALSLDSKKVADDYMYRYTVWKDGFKKKIF
ncbi:MAG: helix-turn-helix domain-containing protein, partial [Deltaproteobacteria bacterium]|nr:helix-turn-helix domain-containing protein [Deltaproteobacteria bacterium]